MPKQGFKACRLLLWNVWHKELTLVQRHILGNLQRKRPAVEREASQKKHGKENKFIRLQTTRPLSLFYSNVRIEEIRWVRGDRSYILLLLHLETRLDGLPQARQLISHGKILHPSIISSYPLG